MPKQKVEEKKNLLLDAQDPDKPKAPLVMYVLGFVFAWLGGGAVIYGCISKKTWSECFYYSINVGFCIGFGTLDDEGSNLSMILDIVMILIGAGFVSNALSYFVTHKLSSQNKVATKRLEQLFAESNQISKFIKLHQQGMLSTVVFTLWLVMGVWFAMHHEEWDFVTSLYFAISALSTAGLQGVNKEDRLDFPWLFVSLFCLFGVPMFGLVVGQSANIFIDQYIEADALKRLKAPITREEFNQVKGLFSNDGSESVNRCEFFILEMIRLGNLDDHQIDRIRSEFEERDTSANGKISWTEIENLQEVRKQRGTP